MMEASQIERVLLLRSDHLAWSGLAAQLRAERSIQVVAELDEAKTLAQAVQECRPDLVLVASELVTPLTVPVLRAMRTDKRASCKVVVLGVLSDPLTLVDLARAGVSACLHWHEYGAGTAALLLQLIREQDVLVLSHTAVERLLAAVDAGVPAPQSPRLTEQEGQILRALATGERRGRIAAQMHVSERTLKRLIAGLQETLEAPTLCALGAKAARLGYAG